MEESIVPPIDFDQVVIDTLERLAREIEHLWNAVRAIQKTDALLWERINELTNKIDNGYSDTGYSS